MSFAIFWANRRIIGEVVGIVLLGIVLWWAFWHNPSVIDGLEKDKAELTRLVDNGVKAQALLDDITKGKVKINAHVQTQISSIRSNAIPRRTVLIHNGGLLPAMYPANTSR